MSGSIIASHDACRAWHHTICGTLWPSRITPDQQQSPTTMNARDGADAPARTSSANRRTLIVARRIRCGRGHRRELMLSRRQEQPECARWRGSTCAASHDFPIRADTTAGMVEDALQSGLQPPIDIVSVPAQGQGILEAGKCESRPRSRRQSTPPLLTRPDPGAAQRVAAIEHSHQHPARKGRERRASPLSSARVRQVRRQPGKLSGCDCTALDHTSTSSSSQKW